MGIYAQRAVDGGEEVRDRYRLFNHLLANFISLANRFPVEEPSTCQNHAERLGLMATPTAAIKFWRPSELRRNHDQCLVEKFVTL